MACWRRASSCSAALLGVLVVGLWASFALAQPPSGDAEPQRDEPSREDPGGTVPASDQPLGEPSADKARPAPDPEVDEATERGRQAYLRGVEHSKNEEWGHALAAFTEAAAARDAPLVQYNITYCLRALGRYVAAHRRATRVLAKPTGLAPSQIDDLKAYLVEFEQLIVRVDVTLKPQTALLTVDGRPLARRAGSKSVFLGSFAPPGKGTAPGVSRFVVWLDPGVHLFRAVRPGHQAAVIRRSYRSGERAKLDLRLDVLPATIAVQSEPERGIVRLDGREVGLAPIEFERRAGSYQLEVELDDYETYSAELDLSPGQRADLTAKLVPYETPIYERWWFWTSAAAVVAGGVVLTYFLTRPEPEPPPYEGGSTGWIVTPQGLRF